LLEATNCGEDKTRLNIILFDETFEAFF
jgi:hypothetical protein